jgi:hypothetical protein
MAKPIVDGIPERTNDSVEVIHLNMLLNTGREAAGKYGIRMVPATVLLDNQGQFLDRQIGRPDVSRLIGKLRLSQDQSH